MNVKLIDPLKTFRANLQTIWRQTCFCLAWVERVCCVCLDLVLFVCYFAFKRLLFVLSVIQLRGWSCRNAIGKSASEHRARQKPRQDARQKPVHCNANSVPLQSLTVMAWPDICVNACMLMLVAKTVRIWNHIRYKNTLYCRIITVLK